MFGDEIPIGNGFSGFTNYEWLADFSESFRSSNVLTLIDSEALKNLCFKNPPIPPRTNYLKKGNANAF